MVLVLLKPARKGELGEGNHFSEAHCCVFFSSSVFVNYLIRQYGDVNANSCSPENMNLKMKMSSERSRASLINLLRNSGNSMYDIV